MQNDVVSPGIITDLHPVYVQKDDLEKELTENLKKCPVPNTEVCNICLKENALKHNKDSETMSLSSISCPMTSNGTESTLQHLKSSVQTKMGYT
eukprot:9428391-Ditylum_brightwellii.AAC.1